MAPDELTLEVAQELLSKAEQGDQPLGYCPDTGRPVYVKVGRFGPYVQLGGPDDEEKPKNASFLKGMDPAQVTLEMALKLLELPRTLGKHPASGEAIISQNGRFGPYIKCGTETRSLPSDLSPLDVTLEQALHLLDQPKTRGRHSATVQPLKVFDASPITGKPVQLLRGRYGPYVTDGVTNASLAKDADPSTLTWEDALRLLAERAAKGPARKGARRTSSVKKSTKDPNPGATRGSTKRPTKKVRSRSAKKRDGRDGTDHEA
jgi:DNA topoisomerase-1